ncbi:MAG: histidine kinase dimerization/phosphoacceptor domain -containing protein [Anaerolineae bacterium]
MGMLRFHWTPLVLPLFVGALLALAGAIETALKTRAQKRWAGIALLPLMAWWTLCQAFEMLAVGLAAKLFFARIAYFGFALMPAVFVVYAARYAGLDRWLTRSRVILLMATGLGFCLLALTNDLHGFVWRSASLNTSTQPAILVKDMTWGFYAFIIYATIGFTAAFGLIIHTLSKALRLHGRQIRALLFGYVFLCCAMVINNVELGRGIRIALEPYAVLLVTLIVSRTLRNVRQSDIISAVQAKVIEQMPDPILVVDTAGMLVSSNRAAREIAIDADGPASQTPIARWCPRLAAHLDLSGAKTTSFELELDTRVQDRRETCIFNVRTVPILDGRDRPVSYLVSMRDVTGRRLVERERQMRHRYLKALWEAIPDAVVVLDPEGIVQEWNAGAERLLKLQAKEAVGEELLKLVELDDDMRRHISAWITDASEGTPLASTPVRYKNPSIDAADLMVGGSQVIVDGTLRALLVVFTDVSELRQAEERLRAVNEELEARVAARTAQLIEANRKLGVEIESHKEAEASLLRRNRELLSLQSAATATGSSLDVTFVLETVTWEMVDLLGTRNCVVYEWVPERDEIVAMADYTGGLLDLTPDKRSLSLSKFPWHRKTLQEKYAQVLSLAEVDMPQPWGDISTSEDCVTLLPMVFQERSVGLVELHSGSENRKLTDRDVSLGQLLASQAAVAIEHARLYERAQREIAERERAERRLKASLHEKDTLLQEIHHRVKNNLQVISSLLKLQSRTVQDPMTLQVLKESQNRLRSMALIHERLYQSENLARIDFAEYLQSLTRYLVRSYRSTSGPVALGFQMESVPLSIERAVPCGLIVNELVSNALKYAFPDGRPGKVEVGLSRANGHVRLSVRDDGVGLPEDLDIDKLESLGLQLVHMLTGQLGGEIQIDTRPGTVFEISFAA